MGTIYSIRLADANLSPHQLDDLKRRVDTRLDEINRLMSHYRPDSELSRFNNAQAGEVVPISPEFGRVLRKAFEIHERSQSAFDPALGAMINAWGFGPEGRDQPFLSPEDIANMQARSGAQHVRFEKDTAIAKDTDGVQLNLSAIAKGYGVDEVARVIRDFGVSNLFVEIGGEVFATGHNPYGKPWRVGVETPVPGRLPGEAIDTILILTNAAVATSGDYRNFRTDPQGRRIAHILDPRTGYPVTNDVASVSVVAPDCMTADALATAAFVLGVERGTAFIESWPGASALFIVRGSNGAFEHKQTRGFEAFVAK